MAFVVRPLTGQRWADLNALFAARGCSMARGCWCMDYRETSSTGVVPGPGASEARRATLHALADRTPSIGLLAYEHDAPVGWVALSPRADYPRLRRSAVAKPVDEVPVWSVVCFVVPPAQRGRGIARTLLDGAIAYARASGAIALQDRRLAALHDEAELGDADRYPWLGGHPLAAVADRTVGHHAEHREVAARWLERG